MQVTNPPPENDRTQVVAAPYNSEIQNSIGRPLIVLVVADSIKPTRFLAGVTDNTLSVTGEIDGDFYLN